MHPHHLPDHYNFGSNVFVDVENLHEAYVVQRQREAVADACPGEVRPSQGEAQDDSQGEGCEDDQIQQVPSTAQVALHLVV